jgi:hypothetical protein
MTNLAKFQGVATTVRTLKGNWGTTIIGTYHQTDVATVEGNKVHLYTGGYRTNTTKVRMNQFANQFCDGAFSVYQRNYEWYVSIKGQEKPILFCGNTCDFEI